MIPDLYQQINVDSRNVTTLLFSFPSGSFLEVYSIYNPPDSNITLYELTTHLQNNPPIHPMLWHGDFNKHDSLWAGPNLSASVAPDEALDLLTLLADHDLDLVLPPGTLTHQSAAHKTWNTIDLVFTSADISDAIITCTALPDLPIPGADHLPIVAILDFDLLRIPDIPRPNFRAVEWTEFNKALAEYLIEHPISTTINSTDDYDSTYLALDKMLQTIVASHVPRLSSCPYAKRWWTKDLTNLLKVARKSERADFKRPTEATAAAKKIATNAFRAAIERTQKQHWKDWLEEADEKSVWLASRYANRPFTDGSTERIPALKRPDGTLATDAQAKCDILFETFFPPAPPTDTLDIPDDCIYPVPFPMPEFTQAMYDDVIRDAKSYSAPGTDGVPFIVLQKAYPIIGDILWALFEATNRLKYETPLLKELFTVVLRKPGRSDYALAKSHRPIALYRCIKKSFCAMFSRMTSFVTEKYQLIPSTHMGGRPGRTTSDAIHLLTSRIKSEFRKGNVVTLISLDIRAAFPNAVLARLLHNMRMRRVPADLVAFYAHDLIGQSTRLKVDDFISIAYTITNGIGQGAPSSGGLYQFYNAPLLEVVTEPKNSEAGAYYDDAYLLAAAPTFEECDEIMDPMAEASRAWSKSHNSGFEETKLGAMHLRAQGRSDEQIPYDWNGTLVPHSDHIKFLGILIDDKLNFKKQAEAAASKGLKVLLACNRLTRPTFGLPHKYVKRLYESVVIPKMTYALDVWYTPITTEPGSTQRRGSVGFARRLGKVQRLAGILITGAIRTTANDLLDLHAHNIPIELRLNQICYKAAIRICTLPDTHPLQPLASRAARYHSIRRHRSALHNLMHAWRLDPRDFETIRPFPVPPTWTPPFTHDIASNKEAALTRARTRSREHDLCLYSDGSGIDNSIGAACITDGRDDSFNRRVHLGSAHDHTVFESEVVGATLALSSVPHLPHLRNLFIGIDSQSAIRALHRPRQQPGQYLLLEFHAELARLKRRAPHLQLHIGWVPGHLDFEPNERVDKEAKSAAQNDATPHPTTPSLFHSPLPRSAAAAKAAFQSQTSASWTTSWISSPRYDRFNRLDKTASVHSYHKPLLDLSRRNSSLIVQLRTRMVGLNAWLFKIHRAESPLCQTCHQREDVTHFIFFCSRFTHHRLILRSALGRKATSLGYLLTNEKGIRHLLRYVHATNRLPLYHDIVPNEPNP